MGWLIGIDGGGTKTVGCAADFSGRILGRVEQGPGNYHTAGIDGFKQVIAGIIQELAGICALPVADLKVVSLGLAGADRPRDKEIILAALVDLGYNCHYLIHSDAEAALVAGLGKKQGIVLIAGTGSVAYGINSRGEVSRAGGWGHLASDEGSGYFLGRQALMRGIRAAEERDKATGLLPMIMDHFGLTGWDELICFINSKNLSKATVASAATVVATAAGQGDRVAIELLEQAADELAGLVKSVLARGFATEADVAVCTYGSVVNHIPLISRRLNTVLGEMVRIVPAGKEPAEGAVQMGIEWLQEKSVRSDGLGGKTGAFADRGGKFPHGWH
ncbi:N-acetylglucosamine kinase [Sporomusa aerivorans]|uniref:N-acetylglucosamine kinase n=1 Tax=Sporomusa aerivorans TaxID=204936 RepID=UPI00352AA632